MEHEEAFINLIEAHKAVIYKLCYMYAPSGEVGDYYQEVVLRLWKAWPGFRGESSPATWIYRVSLYTCLSFVRKRYARPSTQPLTIDLRDDDEGDLEQQLKELRAVIDRLGQIERALILLWLEEKTYDEIAQITGLSKSNVAVKLTRIREKLKRMSNA